MPDEQVLEPSATEEVRPDDAPAVATEEPTAQVEDVQQPPVAEEAVPEPPAVSVATASVTANTSPAIFANHATKMSFGASTSASVVPSTANADNRTIDVIWYGGASVPRYDSDSGKQYKLRLDMAGCQLDRLNAGGAVFDNHQAGNDLDSMMANTVGTKAQIGVVLKAWADGPKGMATLQFAKNDPIADPIWNKVSTGIIKNLSFGTWIYETEPDETVGPNGYLQSDKEREGPQSLVATNWEPFEISPVCVPADFQTAFLAAETAPEKTAAVPAAVTQETTTTNPAHQPETMRASAREEKQPVMEQNQQAPGTEARTESLAAQPVNTDAIRLEAIRLERERVQAIRTAAQPFAGQLDEKFINELIDGGQTLEASRSRILEQLASRTDKLATRGEVAVTRDQSDTRRENMEAALLYKYDRLAHKDKKEQARQYVGFSLIDMAKECLESIGVNPRGMSRQDIARAALNGRNGMESYFANSMASTSDFPNVLANVANKTLRMAYEAYPSSFKMFGREVTATDFKPLNRVQLSDLVALQPINENGEYHRTTPSDSKETYSLATFGEIVAITRQVIVNDDLQAFTRVPAALGTAAATLEANKAWAVLTGNPAMSDGYAVFSTQHSNLNSGAGSALGLAGMAAARAAMRLQKGPSGTPLNLVPRYLLIPAALENTADQLVSPVNIASSDFTKVVPQWIRSMQPIVEPRLDAFSTTAWFLIADPTMIDGLEYCYLEGQEGVYTETRQGFDVDGLEIKARLDFAAAAVEFRGLQENVGA